jgi:hypothetical protein
MRGLLLGLLLVAPAVGRAGDVPRHEARWWEVGVHLRSWHSRPDRCASWADGWAGPGYYYLGQGWAASVVAMPPAGKASETAVVHVTLSRRLGGA